MDYTVHTILQTRILEWVAYPFPGDSECKESACNTGDLGSIPESGRSPGKGNGNPLQHSCLEKPMYRGAWRATVHGVSRVRHDLETKPPLPGQHK